MEIWNWRLKISGEEGADNLEENLRYERTEDEAWEYHQRKVKTVDFIYASHYLKLKM